MIQNRHNLLPRDELQPNPNSGQGTRCNLIWNLSLRQKIMIFAIIVLAIVALVLGIVLATKKNDCPIPIQCLFNHQYIRLNNTGLKNFKIEFIKDQVELDRHKSTNIEELDLSDNRDLNIFDSNCLPDLRTLHMNKNYNLQKFTMNDLPALTRLNHYDAQQCRIQNFSHNNLPLISILNLSNCQLRTFEQNNFTHLSELDVSHTQLTTFTNLNMPRLKKLEFSNTLIQTFQNNMFPNLTSINGFDVNLNLKNVIGNNFGLIKQLKINRNQSDHGINFTQNTLNQLVSLQFTQCWSLDFTDISQNKMPKIKKLSVISSLLQNFKFFNSFEYLREMYFKNTGIVEFSNGHYINLENLTLIQPNLTVFSQNYMYQLKYLTCNGCNFENLCDNNIFQKLEIVNWTNSTNLIQNINCLNYSKNLKNFTFYSNGLSQVSNFNLPKLQNLLIGSSNITVFRNNAFPSLTSFQIVSTGQDVIFEINSYSKHLKNFQITSTGSLSIANQQFLALKKLVLYNMKNVSFLNNSLPVIQRLHLSGLSDGSQFDRATRINPNIQIIQIVNSPMLTSFSYSSILPKIRTINLCNNSLTHLDCSSFKNVHELQLNLNKLTKDVVQILIDCNFNNLQMIDLRQNAIKQEQKEQVRSQLKNKYKDAHIVVRDQD